MERTAWSALGTSAVVAVVGGELARGVAVAHRVLDRIDRACSRFRDDSDLARANAGAGRWVDVGELLLEAVAVGLGAAEATGGLVDPLLGRDLIRWGYDRTFSLVRERDTWRVAASPRRRPAWQELELDEAGGRLRVPAHAVLDLGATAKALAADRVAAAVVADGAEGALVSLGGDIAVAGRPPGAGWCIRIADDHRAPLDGAGPAVLVRSGGLATSATTVRRWVTAAGEAHHVLDPRTGDPVRDTWRAVSVAAVSCVDANVATTAAVVLGRAAPAWLDERRLPARLVADDGSVVRAGGWPVEELAA